MAATGSPSSTRARRGGESSDDVYQRLRAVVDSVSHDVAADAVPLAVVRLAGDVVAGDVKNVMRRSRADKVSKPKTTQKVALKVSAAAMELSLFVSANHLESKVCPGVRAIPGTAVPA